MMASGGTIDIPANVAPASNAVFFGATGWAPGSPFERITPRVPPANTADLDVSVIDDQATVESVLPIDIVEATVMLNNGLVAPVNLEPGLNLIVRGINSHDTRQVCLTYMQDVGGSDNPGIVQGTVRYPLSSGAHGGVRDNTIAVGLQWSFNANAVAHAAVPYEIFVRRLDLREQI